MMKILWLCALPGQVQREALQNIDHGSQVELSWIVAHFPPPKEVELHIACLWPGGILRRDFIYQSVHFHLLPCPRKGRATTFFSFDHLLYKKLFYEMQPDIIHAWGTEDAFGLVAQRLSPTKHVIGIQGLMRECYSAEGGSYRNKITVFTERITLRYARHIIVENPASLQLTLPWCKNGKIFEVIEQPIRIHFLNSKASDGLSKKALFVGTITKRKGFEDCVRAFAQSSPSDWTLQIIGKGDHRSEHALHKLLYNLGVGSRVILTRFLEEKDLIEAMQSSSVLLLPTHIDTGPNVLKEALIMGLWPICYDNSGPGFYIRNFKYGSLAKNLDYDDLCKTVRECFSAKPWMDQKKRMSCIEESRTTFSAKQIWPHLIDVYTRIASGGSK